MSEGSLKFGLKIIKGDRKSFEWVVDEYEKKIFNIIYRMVDDYEDAMDITQTVFMKAYDRLDSYDPSYKFFSWIYKIAVNESINHIKKRKRTVALDYDMATRTMNPEEVLSQSEMAERLQKALTSIQIDYRTVLVLRHFLDLTYTEISEILEIPIKTVKSRLFTGRQLLKSMLVKQQG